MNGATCSADGIVMDGNNDYVDIDDWEWGGTTSIEVYVKYDSFNSWSRVFDFSSGTNSDNVFLANFGSSSTIRWGVTQGSTLESFDWSNFDSSIWTHVVVTVKGTAMKVYKNGVLAGTKTDGHEPNVMTRAQHWLGRSAWSADGYFDGTIAYVKIWHGIELTNSEALSAYDAVPYMCPAGKYNHDGGKSSSSCLDCEAGKSSLEASTRCLSCATGSYTSESGTPECLPCEAGKYGSETGLVACFECETGTYSLTPGSVLCEQCSPGKYMGAMGSTLCMLCDIGHTSGIGSAECSSCMPGKYADSQGTAPCKACSRGKFSTGGASVCQDCPVGFFSAPGAFMCFHPVEHYLYKLTACSSGDASSYGFEGEAKIMEFQLYDENLKPLNCIESEGSNKGSDAVRAFDGHIGTYYSYSYGDDPEDSTSCGWIVCELGEFTSRTSTRNHNTGLAG